jgi:hypothetical protein
MMRRALAIALLGAVLCGCPGRDHGEETRPRETTAPRPAPDSSERPTAAAAESEKYPVQWWEGLQLKSLNGAASLYTSGAGQDFGELKLDGERARPTNCTQWAELHSKRYEPVNTPEEQADNGAKVRCLTLALMQRAQAARTSHIRSLAWDGSMLRVLPASVATVLNRDSVRARDEATAAGKSLSEFVHSARAKPSSEKETLEINEGDTLIVVHAEAWGDFNGDGVDDVALSVVNGTVQGTYASVRLLVLTRTSADGLLKVVEAH